MDKHRPSFADDLATIQQDVTADVGKILQLAKTQSSPAVEAKVEAVPSTPPIAKEVPRRIRRTTSPVAIETPLVSRTLENVTTRLSRETNELLTEVALRQRLKKKTPDTRQAIIESALREFFQRNGYAKEKESGDEGDATSE